MMHKRIINILLISFIIVFSMGFGANYSSARAAGATISGRVVGQNGNGIGGVLVLSDNGELHYAGVRTTTTNPDGSFTLLDVQSGSNHLQAKIDGLALSHYWNTNIADGQIYSNINFTLCPAGGAISGRLVDTGGIGISDALINVFEQTAQGFDNGAWATTTTDANGFFATSPTDAPGPGLPTGVYTVMASKVGLPNVLKNDVVVAAGSTTSNVVLSVVSGTGIITGQITDAASGGPIVGAEVLADNGVIQSVFHTDQHGFYQIFNLPTGSYNVVVKQLGYASGHRYHINVVDGSITSRIDFGLTTSMGQVSGRVVDKNGQPIVGAMILADSDQGTGFGNTTTNSNGEYLLTNIAPMKYYVHATATNLSGLILMAEVYTGQTTSNINFILGEVSGGINGKITKDGVAAPYAAVFVNSSGGSDQMFYRDTIADGNGYYQIQDLPPGTYDVHVYGVPGYINVVRYNIEVGNDIVTGLNFNLTNGHGFVEGYVSDVQGNLLAGATVQLFQLTNPGAWIAATTDSNGHYSAAGLWAGDYNIYADHAEFPTIMKSSIAITDNEPARVDLVLGQDRSLVVNPNNLYVKVEMNSGTFEGVLVDVTAGEATTWTAQSNAEWLQLGNSGEIYEDSGQTGLDGLTLRFDPSNVAFGTYTTDVLLTAPDAQDSIIRVTMSKVDPDSIMRVFLPMIGAGN
ncbi:MAG: carboxypeptidase-like regulatory domain-containing protein [Anaerolineales bacterium]|nr:carboxypeptidase-like regulatory domain-containing protein [Anaerolineales bacterium]